MTDTFTPLNERDKQLARLEEKGTPLYIAEPLRYHLIGAAYDDVRVALCGKTSGRMGKYGVTDDTSGLLLCGDCESAAR
jgi:hypothetical protein